MTRLTLLVCVISFLLPAPSGAYTIELPALPDPGVRGDRLYARIDSLEARLVGSAGTERAALATDLALAHLATGLSSHEAMAQEYFAEATQADPAQGDAARWAAIALQRSGYYTLARQRMGEELARDPDDLDDLLLLARLEFVEARLRSHKHDMSASYQLYLRALALAPERAEVLVGAGSAALLEGNHRLARSCADRLRTEFPERIEGWFLHPAADFRMGNVESAWVDYLRALSLAGADERGVFLGGEILVRDEELAGIARSTIAPERALEVDGAVAASGKIDWVEVVTDPGIRAEVLERWWMRRDPSPEAFENEGELEYWTRLVEADLLFAQSGLGVRGWETLPGEVWIRLGRPLGRRHWLSENAADVTMQEAPEGPGGFALDPPRVYWDWSYVIDGRPVTMRFVDESYGQPRWSVGEGGTVDVGVLRTEMEFVEPARHLPMGTIELHASVARFPRGGQALLETSISAHVPDGSDLALAPTDSLVIEWTLLDPEGETIDQEIRMLSAGSRLSALLARTGRTAVFAGRDPFVAVVGARFDAGIYRIRVRAINPGNGVHTSKTFDVRVPSSREGGTLALSSVQLAHGMPEWGPSVHVPREFVKYGRIVISAADATIAGPALGVFYELENLGLDETGQTRFDVEYAIYEATGQVRLLSMLGTFDPAELEEVELSTVQYLHERTGVSAEGLVVKGTEIDISALREGDYVLQIKVQDQVSDQEARTIVPFRRLAGAPNAVADR